MVGGGGATLTPDQAVKLRRERLAPLDAHLRRTVDLVWSQIGLAQREEPPPPALAELQLSFTQLQLLLGTLERVVELCDCPSKA